jgi:hypothetical protein
MRLQLKYTLTPENAARFAEDIVTSAAAVSGVELDYTPESLELVDGVFDDFRSDGVTAAQIAETVLGFGCYVGEVFTRHAGGHWRLVDGSELAVSGWPLVVQLDEARWCNPIGKAFKRLENGPEDGFGYFYTVFAPMTTSSTSNPSASSR